MNSEYVEEEEDALVSDLIIAAKFATMDVYHTTAPPATDDPCEIDLDEVVPYVKPSTVHVQESSSSSESDDEEEEDDVERYHKRAAMEHDNDSDDDDGMEVDSRYVPYLENSSVAVEITEKDTVVPNALVITAIHLKSNLLVVSATEKALGKPQILDSGSVVCTNTTRQVLGRIDDVFGPVDLPHYTIVCPEAKLVGLELKVGDFVGRVDNMTSLVNIAQLDTHGIDVVEGEEGFDDSDDDDNDNGKLLHKKPQQQQQQRVVKKKKKQAARARPAPPQLVIPPTPVVQQQQQLPPNWPQ